MPQFEPNSSFHGLFANLRVLQLSISLRKLIQSEAEFNLEHLNGLIHLEKLFVDTMVISRTQTLLLPKLKVLSIELCSEDEFQEPRLVLDQEKWKRLSESSS